MADEVITIELQVYDTREGAIRLGPPGLSSSTVDTHRKEWLPLMILDHVGTSVKGEVGKFTMPEYVATKKKFI
jgi:hypothetical protein